MRKIIASCFSLSVYCTAKGHRGWWHYRFDWLGWLRWLKWLEWLECLSQMTGYSHVAFRGTIASRMKGRRLCCYVFHVLLPSILGRSGGGGGKCTKIHIFWRRKNKTTPKVVTRRWRSDYVLNGCSKWWLQLLKKQTSNTAIWRKNPLFTSVHVKIHMKYIHIIMIYKLEVKYQKLRKCLIQDFLR